MFDVVILAAGRASRFGSPKQLAEYNGKPLLQIAIDLCLGKHIKPLVSLGAYFEEIVGCESLKLDECSIIRIKNWSKGLSFSIAESIEKVQGCSSNKGVLFLLADQPMIRGSDFDLLSEAISNNPEAIVCAKYSDSVGVPAYFPETCFEQLKNIQGDRGAKAVIERFEHIAVLLNGPLIDIDTVEDIERAPF